MNDTLGGVSPGRVDSLDRAPAIAILTPYRSYYAYKGLPFVAPGKLASHDPQQDRLFRCLDAVAAAVPSTQRLQIFAVPSMLLTALERFQQVGPRGWLGGRGGRGGCLCVQCYLHMAGWTSSFSTAAPIFSMNVSHMFCGCLCLLR